jgi:hypothetical protein
MKLNSAASSRPHSGRFAPGVSGNPAGRPTGSRNRGSLIEAALREGEAEQLTRLAIDLALAGDRAMLRFCLARLFPVMKGRLVELDLEPGAEEDSAAVLAATLGGVARGEITPDEGLAVGRLVRQQDRAAGRERPVSGLYSGRAAARPAAAAPSAMPAAGPPPACKSPVFPAPAGAGRRAEVPAPAAAAGLPRAA